MGKKLVIDVDTGVDDAQALMMALGDEDAEVLAITCVSGNTNVDQVCLNTLRVLKVCNKLGSVPVHRGCERSLTGKVLEATYHHGEDGLGGVPDVQPTAPSLDLIQTKHAASALVDLVNQYPGELTLVALAPLTNIALALRLDQNFGKKLKECIIMGGNIEGRGNTSPEMFSAEFNFGADPEAASVVLNELGCSIKLLTWEICTTVKLPWDWYLSLNEKTSKGFFHKKIQEYATKRKIDILNMPNYYSCDPAAMVVALDPSTVMETKTHYCTVELQGHWTRGMMVVDWRGVAKKQPNVHIVTEVDVKKVKNYYENMVK